MQIIQRIRKGKHKVSTGQCIFGISAIDGVSGEGRRIAEIFKTRADNTSTSRRSRQSRKRPTLVPTGRLRRAAFDDLPHDLMARDQCFAKWRKFAFHDMQVGSADTTGAHPQKNLPGLMRRSWNIPNPRGCFEMLSAEVRMAAFVSRLLAASLQQVIRSVHRRFHFA